MDVATNDNKPRFIAPTDPDDTATRRAIIEQWRATAPAKDSDILCRRSVTSAPRMAKAAPEFAVLMVWRRLREQSESDGVGSNWFAAFEVGADNDNDSAPMPLVEHDLKEDNAKALLRRLGDYETVCHQEAVLRSDGQGGFVIAERRERVAIIGERTGLFERYPDTQFRKKPRSRTKLTAPGGIRRCGIAVFAGPELRKRGVRVGTLGYLTQSSAFIPLDVDWDYVEHTSAHPPENVIPDVETITDAKQQLVHILPGLGERHEQTLDFALRAKNFAELAKALGLTGSYASKAARRALLAACSALEVELRGLERKLAA